MPAADTPTLFDLLNAAADKAASAKRERETLGGSLRRQAQRWIDRNAEAMRLFEQFALEMARAGRRFGAKLLFERVRWEVYLQTDSASDFKLNNNYTPYVARWLIDRHPHLAQHIETRRTKTA